MVSPGFLILALLGSLHFGYVTSNSEQESIHDIVVGHVLNQANRPVSFRMESPITPFIGRKAEISELTWAHIDKKMVVITGPKGIGKSELAKKYAQDIKVDNTSSTIWINSESHISIIDAFKDLSQTVGLPIENKDRMSIITAALAHFSNRKTLFIFDNSDDENVIVGNLPNMVGKVKNINIIITSRKENWNAELFRIIKLKEFTSEESKEYIKTKLSKEIGMVADDESISELTTLLKSIPLAISESIKEIIKQNYLNPSKVYTITNFIENFKERPPVVETITEVRGPTAEELEDAVSSKIKEEVKRVGDQITDGVKKAGHQVKNEAKRFERRLRKWFG